MYFVPIQAGAERDPAQSGHLPRGGSLGFDTPKTCRSVTRMPSGVKRRSLLAAFTHTPRTHSPHLGALEKWCLSLGEFFGLLDCLIYVADHVKGLLRKAIVFAFD